jgi:AcrR family transcriptional regulator
MVTVGNMTSSTRPERHERRRRHAAADRPAIDHAAARTERRAARREELLDAAVATIRRHGSSTSMEQVATEAGITKPILYRHFGHRDGLTQAVAERFMAEIRRDLGTALAQQAPPRQLLVDTIDTYLAFVEREPQVYRFLMGGTSGGSETVALLSSFMRQVGQEVAMVLGEQLRAVGADSGAAEPWAYGSVGMVHLAGDWWMERQPMPRARLVDYLATLVWSGLDSLTPETPATPAAGADTKETIK